MPGRINASWHAERFAARLDHNGAINAIGDYSLVPAKFTFTPVSHMILMKASIFVRAVGHLDADIYGSNTVLTNGIKLYVSSTDEDAEGSLLGSEHVMNNGDWGRFADHIEVQQFTKGSNAYAVHFEFWQGEGVPIPVNPNQTLTVELHDDFTDLLQHEFRIVGALTR